MINRHKMLETFEEMYGLPGDPIDRDTWENWLGIWAVAWRLAEDALLQTIAAERGGLQRQVDDLLNEPCTAADAG